MGAVRKHESFNQRVNEKSERKQLKEEQKRLERIQQVTVLKRRKAGGKFYANYYLTDLDFADLEAIGEGR